MTKSHVDESPDVKCPYYRHENKWEIHCEGVRPNQCFHAAFSEPRGRMDYERQFCKRHWGQCLIARGQNARYEDLR